MAYRMAGERASMIASIASFAGATGFDPENFPTPSEPVNILQIHGTADEVISYNSGGANRDIPYPGAMETIGIWATYNGCENPETETSFSMDLVANVPGLDTKVTSYSLHPPGGAVELWTIEGGTHGPPMIYIDGTTLFAESIVDWLLAHPKPQQ
jgi:polyhydroxybutyrate depolymerase